MLQLFSPAKLNLFLRILKKREDGFHELASLFQAISLGDTLTYKTSSNDQLTAEGIPMPLDENNLILKAARLFRQKTRLPLYVSVHVNKQIPLEAGLGGGSSNAATTLWAMNELAGRPVKRSELTNWGGELGSDVAFFLSSGTAYCTGRGEIIKPLEDLPYKPEFTLIKPDFGASTPAVYKALKVAELEQRDPLAFLDKFYKSDFAYFNDLEGAAFHVVPELRTVKQQLIAAGYDEAVMAGSGSTFFCLGEPKHPLAANFYVKKAHFVRRENSESWY
ncbi:MAG: 4-(cytidine 5'-diphospho)-2-C-methyl-D-erythritol kinase [Parachlamydiales bacterium]|jgi:4-diphosphocytidyl-2-C-methyl-D-erythritol kinase